MSIENEISISLQMSNRIPSRIWSRIHRYSQSRNREINIFLQFQPNLTWSLTLAFLEIFKSPGRGKWEYSEKIRSIAKEWHQPGYSSLWKRGNGFSILIDILSDLSPIERSSKRGKLKIISPMKLHASYKFNSSRRLNLIQRRDIEKLSRAKKFEKLKWTPPLLFQFPPMFHRLYRYDNDRKRNDDEIKFEKLSRVSTFSFFFFSFSLFRIEK